jgi:GntR family transcriptional regulator
MLLHISDISQDPLHTQISGQIRSMILSGALKDGDMLPSIRSMAKELKVSVITVQRSYDDLTRENLLTAKHGKGYFVKGLTDKKKMEIAEERFMDKLKPLINEAASAGLSMNQIKGAVQKIFKSED